MGAHESFETIDDRFAEKDEYSDAFYDAVEFHRTEETPKSWRDIENKFNERRDGFKHLKQAYGLTSFDSSSYERIVCTLCAQENQAWREPELRTKLPEAGFYFYCEEGLGWRISCQIALLPK